MSWQEIKYNLKLLIFEWDWFYVNRLCRQVDFISFMDSAMQQYGIQQKWVENSRLLPPFPLSFADSNALINIPEAGLHIVIPGSVDQRRKDYAALLPALQIIVQKTKKPFRLTLLGKAGVEAQRRWINPLKQLSAQCPHFSLQWFDRRIDQIHFEQIMSSAHILLAPVQSYYFFKIYKEWYGKTKMSGINNDIIRFLKPCLLPDEYLIADALKPLTIGYSNKNNLADRLSEWIENPDGLSIFIPAAQQIQQRFLPERQKQEFKLLLKSLLTENK
jgi:hypothetical protein